MLPEVGYITTKFWDMFMILSKRNASQNEKIVSESEMVNL